MYSPGVYLTEQLINIITNLTHTFPRQILANPDLMEYMTALMNEDSCLVTAIINIYTEDNLQQRKYAENVLLSVISVFTR